MEIVLNDETVAEAVKNHASEMMQLAKLATIEEAEDLLKNVSQYDLNAFLPKGTISGEIRRAKKDGVVRSYGFIESGHGDVFVPPHLMSDYKDGEVVAARVNDGPRGKVADKIALIDDYISWHKDEILAKVMEFINARKKQELEWSSRRDPSNGWYEMKDRCNSIGLDLIEIRKETKSSNYGGRGSDHYRFASSITEEKAAEVLNVLGARHAEADPKGPYDPGYDRIVLTENGFKNDWHGPWTD